MKRRICSYDLAAVPEDGYVVTDDEGEIYLCNARCLCIYAVSLATKPGLSEEFKARRLVLKVPPGEELMFETIIGLARWASAHALGVEVIGARADGSGQSPLKVRGTRKRRQSEK
jgi:hypothetical protein